jgi:phage tail sheath gpL-like
MQLLIIALKLSTIKQIKNNMSYPNVNANINSAKTFINSDSRSILIVAPMLSGTATSGVVVENLLSEAEFNTAFGRQSRLAKVGRQIIKGCSVSRTKPKISAIGLSDNAGGVAATGTIAVSGTATANGTFTFYVDSTRSKYEIAITSGQTATQVGASIVSAITADLDSVVSAVNTTGSVVLTALNKGTCGNSIGITYKGSIAGLTITLTAFSGGATNPSLTALFDTIADKRYTTIVYPADWTLSNLYTLTEGRFNVNNNILDGLGIVATADTYANHNTTIDGLNYKTLAYIPNKLINSATKKGGAIFEDPIVIACYGAVVRDLRLTENSNVSELTTNGISTGGAYFGAIPYHNTPFVLLPTIPAGEDFSNEEALELENSGAWLLRNNSTNTYLVSQEAVTTYKTNILGAVDKTFKYINYFDTLSLVREIIFYNLKQDFSQVILTDGDLVAGLPQVNRDSIISTMTGYYLRLSDTGYGLLRKGSAQRDAFAKAINDSIIVNLVNGTVTLESIANITTQLRNIIINFTPTFE